MDRFAGHAGNPLIAHCTLDSEELRSIRSRVEYLFAPHDAFFNLQFPLLLLERVLLSCTSRHKRLAKSIVPTGEQDG